MKTAFTSVLGPTIANYLSLKETLGRKYSVERDVFSHLDSFLAVIGEDLNSESFGKWIETRLHLTSGVRRKWMRIVRNLCLYRLRREPVCFVPDTSLFPLPHQTVRPYIFTENEIARLLEAASRLWPSALSPLRAENFFLGLVLLYTAGLRRGELLRLTIGDYEPSDKTLLIRESKFHKSRLLPLSVDGARTIEAFLLKRRRDSLPFSVNSPLLYNKCGRTGAYSGTGFAQTVGSLLRAEGITTETGKIPRIHDFRHTFAVHAMLRWYRRGKDVQAKMPALATYMGHVSIASTQYYLSTVTELASIASDRFEMCYGGLVEEFHRGGGMQ